MKRKVGKALVVGAGISGIRSALDLAEFGYGVILIDCSPHLGGILSKLDYQFPTDRCGMCRMLPLVDRDASSQYCLRKGLFHENIEIMLSTELISIQGEPGNFKALLRQKPTWVDPELCIGCGLCVDACPVEIPDEFNEGLSKRKAIYLPVPHNIPNPYVIDFTACTRCGECEKVCPTSAIRLAEQERRKFRILVVDDELIVRDSLKEWLDEEGFLVDMAESGSQAIEMLSKNPYQLMLTDIKMPGMDGVEVLEKAKEIFSELTVVMMTAYATVETAVEAMKIGAHDYLIKPFDPEKLIPMILRIYEDLEATKGREINVGALILSGGTSYFDPATGKNTFGYGIYSNVMTSLEFERIFSGSGPTQGKLLRPSDGKPIRSIAWVQCIGSRDLQTNADFCSNICCMFAVKEALAAKKKTNGKLAATIFYMDMRTFGKSYQRYRDQAQKDQGIRFKRGRIHSVVWDESSGDLVIRYTDNSGEIFEDRQDLLILTVGQRPIPDMDKLADIAEIDLNPWGFAATQPFSLIRTSREGIFVGGAFAGLRDISDSVIQASAAAAGASRIIHSSGGSLAEQKSHEAETLDVTREIPMALIVICTCGEELSRRIDLDKVIARLKLDPTVGHIEIMEQTCTCAGWKSLIELVQNTKPNRLLIGSCLPYVYAQKLRELEQQVGLSSALMEAVDIRTPLFVNKDSEAKEISASIQSILSMGLAKLKQTDPSPTKTIPIQQKAIVVGGGIAGMTAALTVADHGYPVDLIEEEDQLGGNLRWIKKTIDGHPTRELMDQTMTKIEKHPHVQIHTQAKIVDALGQVGHFVTTIENQKGNTQSISHGVTILATGGLEATTTAYGYGTSPGIVTQKELGIRIEENSLDLGQLETVVMIQCVDSREEPRNYCSRICCASALKHALDLKEHNPDITIYILYRDMMAYGFMESYYTRARKSGIIFIQYDPENKPQAQVKENGILVKTFEPIIGKNVEIETNLLVLATGIIPNLPEGLADSLGVSLDPDGFFQEAESKWRPMDAIKEGVFACGLAHSPRSITEAIATGEAAAQRSLRILSHAHLPAGQIVARVRHSLCSLCEQCIETCPYAARTLIADQEKVTVNPAMCQGCGACATVCPNSASVVLGFTGQQMLDVIDSAL